MIQLLYFGRLDTEKWLPAILAMVSYFADTKNQTLPFVLHIFGSGEYEQKVLEFAEQFPEHIIYYGFQPLEHVKKIADQCDYCLMPSLFLETFWLSAVNALSRWLPVIGYQKGWLSPFVLDTYNLSSNPGSPDVQLITMIEKLLQQWWHNDSHTCTKIAETYNTKHRIEQCKKIIAPETKKILLVTDFASKLGGIETYIYDVASLLQENGYSVEIVWGRWWKTWVSRIFSMLFSVCNITFTRRLQRKIQQFQPDLIRCHSVLRNVWWFPLYIINTSTANKRMMYHDFWYFHPFPRTVTTETQIPSSLTWKDFSGSINNPVKKIFVRGKWILLQLLQKQLKKFDVHLVPSDFMKKYVEHNYTENTVLTLSHFIQR